jgi:hypothetical protein
MTTMLSEVYDALIEAGASQEKARKAAEAVAGYENKFANIDMKLPKVEGELALIKWMIGFVLAGVAALILRAFFP